MRTPAAAATRPGAVVHWTPCAGAAARTAAGGARQQVAEDAPHARTPAERFESDPTRPVGASAAAATADQPGWMEWRSIERRGNQNCEEAPEHARSGGFVWWAGGRSIWAGWVARADGLSMEPTRGHKRMRTGRGLRLGDALPKHLRSYLLRIISVVCSSTQPMRLSSSS
eukprot:7376866-Prymnesium_polylepis.1